MKQRVIYILAQEWVERVGLILFVERYKGGDGKLQRMTDYLSHLSEEDLQIAQELERLSQKDRHWRYGPKFPLMGHPGSLLLKHIILTGHAHWVNHNNPPLTLAEPRKGILEWQKEPMGLQRLHCRISGKSHSILPLMPPWYVDHEQYQCGFVETGLEPTVASILLSAPALRLEQIRVLQQILAQSDPAALLAKVTDWQTGETSNKEISEDEIEWYGDIEEVGQSWFDLELGVIVDGQRINLLPLLVNMLGHEELISPIRLPDGRLLSIPIERIRGILNVLTELYDKFPLHHRSRLRLASAQAGLLVDLPVHWFGEKRLLSLGRKLRDFDGLQKVSVPKGFKATLRPYQREGLNWLQFLREYSFGGILADDMGLGKTVQALAHILLEKESGRMKQPSLVIAPTSLMANWRQEAQRFTPELSVLVLHGDMRKQHFHKIKKYDLILTTYPLLRRDADILLAQEYHLLILDEAQVVKNPRAQATQIIQRFQAQHRLCLTGTPMENHLGELWSLFHFLMPGFLREQQRFNRLFRTPIEKLGDAERRHALSKRIAPFLLRRTKQAVATELPPKTEILRMVEMADHQRDLYESIRLAMHDKVIQVIQEKGLANSQIIILDALLKLRQTCCDPRLLKLSSAKQLSARSAKLELLMDMIPNLVEEGRRILLFSQFAEMLKLIEKELKQHGFPYVILTGKTKDRESVIESFQSGKVPIFLISLKAGGTGLNLTAADTVIHYDPWWNPAVENQATDRAYRIGQDKPVFVYKLLTAGTVEEKIMALQEKKQLLMEGLFAEDGHKMQLSREDLENLFEPLLGENV